LEDSPDFASGSARLQSIVKVDRKDRVSFGRFFDKLYANITGNATLTSSSGVMTNIEQRVNMYHLVSQVLAYSVEGDFVELGCNTRVSSV
jgi:O-methyltransferase